MTHASNFDRMPFLAPAMTHMRRLPAGAEPGFAGRIGARPSPFPLSHGCSIKHYRNTNTTHKYTDKDSYSYSFTVSKIISWAMRHVHFPSIEVARFLFARWRGWAHWTRASRLTQLVPFCLVVVQVVGPIIPISG